MHIGSTNHFNLKALFPIYLPWLLSICLQLLPELSYIVSWLGSLFIFYYTLHSSSPMLNNQRPSHQYLMRPIVLIQLIFAGFMCCSSIFYFINYQDYDFINHIHDRTNPPEEQIYRIAKCQRLCLLAHCALITGMYIAGSDSQRPAYQLRISTDLFLIVLSISSLIFSFILARFSGTVQISLMLSKLHLFSGSMLLVRAMKQKHLIGFILGALIFLFSLGTNLFTGYKESIIIHFILLAFLLYPLYPATTKIALVPLALTVFVFLPSFTIGIRKLAWMEHRQNTKIQQRAYLYLLEQQPQEMADNNWEFLTNRFSEIGMFTQFIKKVPDERPYYGWEIFQNAVRALVPRMFWPSKPNTEKIAMKRVYELGVANPASNVSAKSRPVVDGYLSAGTAGVFAAIFIYGLLVQLICNTAIRWHGGDELGCAVMFNGIFQPLWRGNNFEFILNNIVYGVLLMAVIFHLLRLSRIVVPKY